MSIPWWEYGDITVITVITVINVSQQEALKEVAAVDNLVSHLLLEDDVKVACQWWAWTIPRNQLGICCACCFCRSCSSHVSVAWDGVALEMFVVLAGHSHSTIKLSTLDYGWVSQPKMKITMKRLKPNSRSRFGYCSIQFRRQWLLLSTEQ